MNPLGPQKQTPSNVLAFLPKTNIEHVDSTTIVEKSEMTAEQRALFMEAYADAIERAEGEGHEKVVDIMQRADFSGLRKHD